MLKAWSFRCVGCLIALSVAHLAPCMGQAIGQPAAISEPATAGSFGQWTLLDLPSTSDADETDAQRPVLADDEVLEEGPPAWPFKFTFTPKLYMGQAYGYTQASRGNAAGSSSHHRPRLSEVGISDMLIPDLEMGIARGPHEIYAGIQIIRMRGTETLRELLNTAGQTFARGTRVRTDENQDWYRLGYRYSIPFLQGEDGIPRLTATPQAEVDWWTFEYRMLHNLGTNQTTGAALGKKEAKASLDRFTVRGGVGLEWRPYGGPLTIDGKLMASPPIDNFLFIASEEFNVRYRLLDTGRFGFGVFTGVLFEQIDYSNGGKVPDHIHTGFGPLFTLGMEIRF